MNNVRRNFLKLGALGACTLALPLDRLLAEDSPPRKPVLRSPRSS